MDWADISAARRLHPGVGAHPADDLIADLKAALS